MNVYVIVEAATKQIMMPTAFVSEDAAGIYLQGTCSWNRRGDWPGRYIAVPLEARWSVDDLVDPTGTRARLRSGPREWWEVMIGRGDDLRYHGGWLIAAFKCLCVAVPIELVGRMIIAQPMLRQIPWYWLLPLTIAFFKNVPHLDVPRPVDAPVEPNT